jgi:hypothetical protein
VLGASNVPALFTEDNFLSAPGVGAFSWPPMQLSRVTARSPTKAVLSDAAMNGYLADFEASAAAWPAYVSTAFPRYHDIYARAGVGPSYGYLDDLRGHTLRETLSRAMTNGSAMIQVATWNDYGEGTVIEPTMTGGERTTEYGYTDLGIIQDFRRQYLDANFPYHTNDLALALRLFNLRKQYSNDQRAGAELDRIFTNIASGKLMTANNELSGLESSRPAVYNLSGPKLQRHFAAGGDRLAGPHVEVSTKRLNWQPAQTYPASTNQLTFSTDGALP